MSHGPIKGRAPVTLVDSTGADIGTGANPLHASISGAGSGGTSSVDKDAFTAGTSAGTMAMGVVNPVDTPGDGKIVGLALDSNRNVKVNIVAGSSGNGAASNTGAAVPTQADYQGVKVGANLVGATGTNMDSGVGTEYAQNVSLRKTASGGSVEYGTLSDPIRVNPTGTTTQPVSGTVTESNFPATVDTNSGNKSASTLRVVLATDQPALTNKLLVTPDLPSGASTAAKQPALGTAGTPSADVITIQGVTSMTAVKVDNSAVTQPISTPKSSTASAAAQATISTVAAQAIAANSNRKKLLIQNTGLTVLKFVYGAGTPTQTAYHFALAACGGADDGSSPLYVDDTWTGAVQVISSASGGTYVITELT